MSKSESEILLDLKKIDHLIPQNRISIKYVIVQGTSCPWLRQKKLAMEIISKMMENIFNFLTVLSHRVFFASFHVGIFILNSI